MTRTPLVAANWKMNGRYGLVAELGAALAAADLGSAEVVVCPPFPYLQALGAELKDSGVGLGAQTLCDTRTAPSPGKYRRKCWWIWAAAT